MSKMAREPQKSRSNASVGFRDVLRCRAGRDRAGRVGDGDAGVELLLEIGLSRLEIGGALRLQVADAKREEEGNGRATLIKRSQNRCEFSLTWGIRASPVTS